MGLFKPLRFVGWKLIFFFHFLALRRTRGQFSRRLWQANECTARHDSMLRDHLIQMLIFPPPSDWTANFELT